MLFIYHTISCMILSHKYHTANHRSILESQKSWKIYVLCRFPGCYVTLTLICCWQCDTVWSFYNTIQYAIDGLLQDCSNSSAFAMVLLQSSQSHRYDVAALKWLKLNMTQSLNSQKTSHNFQVSAHPRTSEKMHPIMMAPHNGISSTDAKNLNPNGDNSII